jgi:hypothetical protein
VEAFFVVVLAAVLLGVGVLAVVLIRQFLTFAAPRPGDD